MLCLTIYIKATADVWYVLMLKNKFQESFTVKMKWNLVKFNKFHSFSCCENNTLLEMHSEFQIPEMQIFQTLSSLL